MPGVARLGDVSNHNGRMIGASTDVKADGIGISRAGDIHQCPIPGHGSTPMSSTSTRKVNGRSVVRAGIDAAGCGARIVSGSPTVKVTT